MLNGGLERLLSCSAATAWPSEPMISLAGMIEAKRQAAFENLVDERRQPFEGSIQPIEPTGRGHRGARFDGHRDVIDDTGGEGDPGEQQQGAPAANQCCCRNRNGIDTQHLFRSLRIDRGSLERHVYRPIMMLGRANVSATIAIPRPTKMNTIIS